VGNLIAEINPKDRRAFFPGIPFGRYGKVVGFTNIVRGPGHRGELLNSPRGVKEGEAGESEPIFIRECYVVCDFIGETRKDITREVKPSANILVFSPIESRNDLSRWEPLLSTNAITVGNSVEGVDPGQIPQVLELHLYSDSLLDAEREQLRSNTKRKPDIGGYIDAISEKVQELSKQIDPVNMGILNSEYKKLLKSAAENTARRGGRRTFRKRSKKSRRRYKA
jgi:hypothetical protein